MAFDQGHRPPDREPESPAEIVLCFLLDAWDCEIVLDGRTGKQAFAAFAELINRDPVVLAAQIDGGQR